MLDKANHSILLKKYLPGSSPVLSLQGYESTQLKLKVSRKGFRFLPGIIEKKIKLTLNSDKEAVSTCWNQKQFG